MIQLLKTVTTLTWLATLAIGVSSCSNESAAPAEAAQPAKDTTLTVAVSGMTCGGCSSAITETLQPIPGVKAVDVNHETGKAVITTNGNADLPEKLVATIKELGFEATVK